MQEPAGHAVPWIVSIALPSEDAAPLTTPLTDAGKVAPVPPSPAASPCPDASPGGCASTAASFGWLASPPRLASLPGFASPPRLASSPRPASSPRLESSPPSNEEGGALLPLSLPKHATAFETRRESAIEATAVRRGQRTIGASSRNRRQLAKPGCNPRLTTRRAAAAPTTPAAAHLTTSTGRTEAAQDEATHERREECAAAGRRYAAMATTSFPFASPASITLWASWISSKRNTLAGLAL